MVGCWRCTYPSIHFFVSRSRSVVWCVVWCVCGVLWWCGVVVCCVVVLWWCVCVVCGEAWHTLSLSLALSPSSSLSLFLEKNKKEKGVENEEKRGKKGTRKGKTRSLLESPASVQTYQNYTRQKICLATPSAPLHNGLYMSTCIPTNPNLVQRTLTTQILRFRLSPLIQRYHLRPHVPAGGPQHLHPLLI